MRRDASFISAILLVVLLGAATPAQALSDFDADDVEGPLDLRWIGAWFTRDNDVRVTVSFYDGFRVSALPRVHSLDRTMVRVQLTTYIDGLYVRRHGRIVLFYGDFGSSCGADFPRSCERARVRRSSENVLKVRFPDIGDPADPSYEIRPLLRCGEKAPR
jgi:hypothetical protein